MIRQKTCLMADGRDLRGVLLSAAASPTSSVPKKAKAAVTNTEQNPIHQSVSSLNMFGAIFCLLYSVELRHEHILLSGSEETTYP